MVKPNKANDKLLRKRKKKHERVATFLYQRNQWICVTSVALHRGEQTHTHTHVCAHTHTRAHTHTHARTHTGLGNGYNNSPGHIVYPVSLSFHAYTYISIYLYIHIYRDRERDRQIDFKKQVHIILDIC